VKHLPPSVAGYVDESLKQFHGDRLAVLENRIASLEARLDSHPNHKPAVASPYLTAEEAADYLRLNVNALYSLVERRKLRPLPGHRKYRFTREMLDKYLKGG
jgi:excisionase family DNA binding protein